MGQMAEQLPETMAAPGVSLRSEAWGGMTCNYNQFSAGIDFTPLLQGLPDDLCPCPHWGFVLRGSVHTRYTDGREEVVRAGELFYWPPGHTVWFDEDSAYVEFSPEEEMNAILRHVTGTARGEGDG